MAEMSYFHGISRFPLPPALRSLTFAKNFKNHGFLLYITVIWPLMFARARP